MPCTGRGRPPTTGGRPFRCRTACPGSTGPRVDVSPCGRVDRRIRPQGDTRVVHRLSAVSTRVIHRLVCVNARTWRGSPPLWSSGAVHARHVPNPLVSRGSGVLVALPAPAAPTSGYDRVNDQGTRHGRHLWTNLCTASLPGFGRSVEGSRKKIWRFLVEVIHRRGVKSVDNLVDNLWISAPRLWVTHPEPVDRTSCHPMTKPQSAVDNLGKTCGRACGRGVENLRTTSFVHKRAKLPTGLPTGPVDRNSRSDLQER